MSRKFSIRMPDDLYRTLDQYVGNASLSGAIVSVLQQTVRGQRPFLESDTAAQFVAYCKAYSLKSTDAVRQLLSVTQKESKADVAQE